MHFRTQQKQQESLTCGAWLPQPQQALRLLLIIAVTLQRAVLLRSSTIVDAAAPTTRGASHVQQNGTAAINAAANEKSFEQIVLQKLQEEEEEQAKRREQDSLPQQSSPSSSSSSSSSSTELLSRKRRYLIFPEGSSFQVVYDLIIGWVDYANYLVLGVTVALAWELPTETPSAVLQKLEDRLKDGSIGVTRRNDSISNITYVDTKAKYKPNFINLAQTQKQTNVSARPAYNYYTNRRVLPLFQVPMHQKYHNYNNYYRPSDSYYRPSRRKYVSYQRKPGAWQPKYGYYSSVKQQPFSQWSSKPAYSFAPQALSAATAAKYPWWNLASRLSNSLRTKSRAPAAGRAPVSVSAPTSAPARRFDNPGKSKSSQPRQQPKQQQQQRRTPSGYFQYNSATARKHRIYPIFGKRSIRATTLHNDCSNSTEHTSGKVSSHCSSSAHHRVKRNGIAGPELSQLDRIHIRYQRSSRQTLYDKIEKYLDRRGSHGQHCVLRALCETGQKQLRDRGPGSFVGELMRAVFSMPEPLEEDVQEQRVHYMQQHYDAASVYSGDCATRYQRCKDSLWTSEFVI